MRWKVFLIFMLISLFLLSSPVFAESEIVVEPIDNEITTAETASFSLNIRNRDGRRQRYSIYSLQSGQGWNVDPFPLKDKIIDLAAGKEYTTTLNVHPLEEFSPGIYHVYVTIESDLGERYSQALKIYLAPENPVDYLPSIKVDLDMDEKIDPKESVSIKLFLDNRNPLDLNNLNVKIQSEIPEFRKEVTIDLPPLDQKLVEFTVVPNPFQQPKTYKLFFVFEKNSQTVKVVEQDIEIIPLVPGFSVELLEETIFLKTFGQVTITNTGNVLNRQEVKVPISFWRGLFTSGDGDVQKIDGRRYLVWTVSLAPNESTIVRMVTNYRILVYVLAILLFSFLFYLYAQSPISITKKAVITASDREGSISEIKVTLNVKNRSKKKFKEIIIADKVPGIANVHGGLELGTLKPRAIKQLKKGTKVIWSLAELDSQEHRLITYKVRAKLHIVGVFSLPRATVKYRKRRGKVGKAYSNLFRLGR